MAAHSGVGALKVGINLLQLSFGMNDKDDLVRPLVLMEAKRSLTTTTAFLLGEREIMGLLDPLVIQLYIKGRG